MNALVRRPRLTAGDTNTRRWAARVWAITPRREGWFVDTPWFTLLLVRKP